MDSKEDKDDDTIVDFVNVFLCYFKNLFQKNPEYNMFNDINFDDDTSTNRCMEFMCAELYKFKQLQQEDETINDIYDPDTINIDATDELYVLEIDNKQHKVSRSLIPILKYVSGLDWTEIIWSVIPLKTNH
jgi:hypothetical protein